MNPNTQNLDEIDSTIDNLIAVGKLHCPLRCIDVPCVGFHVRHEPDSDGPGGVNYVCLECAHCGCRSRDEINVLGNRQKLVEEWADGEMAALPLVTGKTLNEADALIGTILRHDDSTPTTPGASHGCVEVRHIHSVIVSLLADKQKGRPRSRKLR